MPKIKQAFRTQGLTTQPGAARTVGQLSANSPVGKALEQAGIGLAGIGEDIQRIREKEQQEKDLIYINDSMTYFRQNFTPKVAEYKSLKGREAEGLVDRLQTDYDELLEGMRKNAPRDRVWSVLQSRLAATSEGDFMSIDLYERTERRNTGRAGINNHAAEIIKRVQDNPGAWLDEIENADEVLEAGGAAGFLTAEEVQAKKDKVRAEIVNAQIHTRIKREPAAVQNDLKAGMYDDYIGPQAKNAYIDKANGLIKTREADLGVIRKHNEEKAQNAENLRLEDVYAKLDEALNSDSLTNEQIEDALSQGPEFSELTRNKAVRTYKNRLSGKLNKSKDGEDDPAELARLSRLIDVDSINMSEDEKRELQNEVYDSTGLTIKTKSTLTRRIKFGKAKSTDKVGSYAYERLDFARTDNLFNPKDSGDNDRQWAKYKELLDEYIENNKDNPDFDPQGFVDEILKPVNEEGIGNWLSGIFGGEFESEATERLRVEKEVRLEAEARGAVLVEGARTKDGNPVYRLPSGEYWTP